MARTRTNLLTVGRVALIAWVLGSCASAGQPVAPEQPASAPTPMPNWSAAPETRPAARNRAVQVSGIEGTMSSYDVEDTMRRRFDALQKCYMKRLRRLRPLEGRVQLGLHILRDGTVSETDLLDSSLGDRTTELCILEVARATRFPEPHGGEADVKWEFSMESPYPGRGIIECEPEELETAIEEQSGELVEACGRLPRRKTIRVTLYVNRRGRVRAAGASVDATGNGALLDCVSSEVRKWKLPRARKGRLAKLSFELP